MILIKYIGEIEILEDEPKETSQGESKAQPSVYLSRVCIVIHQQSSFFQITNDSRAANEALH